MKKLLAMLLAVWIYSIVFSSPDEANASTKKIGVLFSDQNETYMYSTNPGGTYTPPHFTYPMSVSPKVRYSSALNKSTKMYAFYQEQGYDVHKIYDADLNSLGRLSTYDAIVLPYTVMLSHAQRQNIRNYVYGGGNAQFLFGTARNELANYQANSSKMDLSPMIYEVLTYIWEWDNLTEVFQGEFIDDVILNNMMIANKPGSTHPILTGAYKITGRSSIQLKESGQEWIESVKPWSTSNAQTILTYSDYSLSPPYSGGILTEKSKNVSKGQTPALLAMQHGAGRVVYSTFKIYDFIQVEKGAHKWKDTSTAHLADGNTQGAQDAQAVLKSSMDWLLTPNTAFQPRKYDVKISTSNLAANMTPGKKFALRGSVTLKNAGNVPARGYLKVEALDANNKVLGQYSKLLTGLSPDNSTHSAYTEKFEILLPGTIKDGAYTLKISFKETRHDKPNAGYVTRAERLIVTKKGNYGSYANIAGFKDVSSGSHLININNAAKIGIITGYSNGTFLPSNNVSRLQAMTMMLRAMGAAPSATATLPVSVTDLKKGAYGYDVMATAYQLGLVNIEKDNKINASGPMRRGEMAQALVKGFQLAGSAEMSFTDIGTPSSSAQYHHIATLYHHRITTGKTATLYGPYDPVTRAQFATFIMRSLENSSK